MHELVPEEFSSDPTDAPTPEQAAILQYLDLGPTEGMTQAEAGALISQLEADPAGGEKLRAWHREKYRLHPDLFIPPQRSFREARWWQARISDDSLYGYSFQQPSLDQTFAIFEALDRQEPDWDHESAKRRETRFMNELATLSPELCKPGCAFPQELPADGATEEPPAVPVVPPLSAPSTPSMPDPYAPVSAPFVPDQYAPKSLPFVPPSQPSWQPPVQPPGLTPPPRRDADHAPVKSNGGGAGAWKWVLLAAVLAAGAGAYFYHGFQPPTLERGGGVASSTTASPSVASSSVAPSPARVSAPVAASESRKRAMAKYPDLAKAGSALNAKFVVAFRELESAHDPLLQQPDWPERLAARCADALTPPRPTPSKATSTPKPAPSLAAVTPSPAPVVQPPTASPAAAKTTTVSMAVVTAPNPAAAATPAERLFITLDAVNKSRANNYSYHWSPYYYADYDISFRQTVGIEVKVRNMARTTAAVNLRWMFFGRKTASNERYVFSASQKRVELTPGQTVSDVLDSPMLQSRAAVSYSYGTHYYSGSKYEGWLVQVLPEGSDAVASQVGSSGYIEDYGKRSDLTAVLKEQLRQ